MERVYICKLGSFKIRFMKKVFNSMKMDWLFDPNSSPTLLTNIGNEEWVVAPFPPEIGTGRSLSLQLEAGFSVFRVEHRFAKTAPKMMLPLATIEMKFNELTLMVECAETGMAIQRGTYPQGEFIGKPGLDIFRFMDHLQFERLIDTSTNINGTGLAIGESTLFNLMGEKESLQLLQKLDLSNQPKTIAHNIPLHVSKHLHQAIPTNLTGPIRKLHSQARVLDYLDSLFEYFQGLRVNKLSRSREKTRAQELQSYLLNLEGKVPTLSELANVFACSAKTLNNEFTVEMGTSIFNFITNHRLDQAHEAIKQSDISLKILAQKIGYAHVNHFSAAFKNRFGYSPGSLRKTN